MQDIKYSKLRNEAEKYLAWSKETPIPPVPAGVAREGAGSELRTPLMHYGVVMPVYMSIARYLAELKPKKGMRLIELGSGSGRPLSYLQVLFPELEIWGVDYSEAGITYAKKSYGHLGVKFKHVPAQKTTLKPGYFDFVISSHVIEHVTKDEGLAFAQEAHRLLKPGGYAFIGTPERRKCQELYMQNPTDTKKYRLVPPHEHEYTLDELWSLGERVFSKKNVRVDALVNPTFYTVFKTSIDKFKPRKNLVSKGINVTYRTIRDKAPRQVFDRITRIGAGRQMKQHNTSFEDILCDNRIAAAKQSVIPENLLLVCKK
jgi:2-polyprenyl-3-methyl-5-hydroxy-6-metoxy-1,4-benzoquinol methylase